MPTGSIVYRREENFKLPDWFSEVASGDQALLLLLSLKGKFKYFNELMGVYRIHDGGISKTHINDFKVVSMMYLLQKFNMETNQIYQDAIFNRISDEIKRHHPAYENLKREKANEIDDLKSLNKKILNSDAYKIGRCITGLFSFLKTKSS